MNEQQWMTLDLEYAQETSRTALEAAKTRPLNQTELAALRWLLAIPERRQSDPLMSL
jgi:hypothetical protein